MRSSAPTASAGMPAATRSTSLTPIAAVAVAIFAIAFACVSFTRETNSVASLWPANAVLLAILLRGAPDLVRAALMLIAATIGFLTASMAGGRGLAVAMSAATANTGEVVAALWLLSACGCATSELSHPRHLALFLILAAGTAPIVGASIGAAAVAISLDQPLSRLWLTWYTSDALGMAIVAPLALSIGAGEWRRIQDQDRVREALAVLGLVIVVATLTGYFRSFLFVTAPLVLFATFRFGVLGSATATLVVALIATALIVTNFGPPLLSQSGMSERILVLQIFLAVTVLWSLPVAAALAERDRFAAQLAQAKERAEALSETKSQSLIRLQRKLWKAEEDERLRLAHELHDRTGQDLAVAMLELSQIERVVSPTALQHVQRLNVQLQEIGRTLHDIAWELRPSSIDELGLSKALSEYVATWSEKFGIDAEYQCVDPDMDRCSSEFGGAIYRITQEALTNIAKHATGANAVSVSINRSSNVLRLTIEDNGSGFDTRSLDGKHAGLGLAGMRERLAAINGELDIESTIGTGTTLFARIPLTDGAGS